MSLALESVATRQWAIPTEGAPAAARRHPTSPLTKRLKSLQVGADAVGVSAALLIVWRATVDGGERTQLLFAFACLPIWLVTFSHYKLYAARTVASRLEESSRLLRAIMVSVAGIAVASSALGFQASRSLVIGTAALAFPICLAEREGLRWKFRRMRSSGRLRRRVVIIGGGEEAKSFVRMFQKAPHLGYEAVGFCAAGKESGVDVPWLGAIESAPDLVVAAGATTALIATTSLHPEEVNRAVRRLHDAGIHVELSASLRDIPADRLRVRDLGWHAVLYLEPIRHGGWRSVAKRAFDVSLSLSALIILSPVLVVCALLIKATSRGAVLFHQERVGQDGAIFHIHKFRTMVDGADATVIDLVGQNEADGPLFKLRDDPRVTPIGEVLRPFSIDELPQLWNVLKGEMSLVGPRPALPHELAGWTPELHNRLRVKPGLTGMWQVSGRSNCSFEDYIRHDLFYVDNWTLCRDLVILGKTVPAVLMRRGAC